MGGSGIIFHSVCFRQLVHNTSVIFHAPWTLSAPDNNMMALVIIKLCFCQIITVSGLSVTLFKNLSLMHGLCDSLLKEMCRRVWDSPGLKHSHFFWLHISSPAPPENSASFRPLHFNIQMLLSNYGGDIYIYFFNCKLFIKCDSKLITPWQFIHSFFLENILHVIFKLFQRAHRFLKKQILFPGCLQY